MYRLLKREEKEMNSLKVNDNKKLGIGTMSLVLSIIAIMFSNTYLSGEKRPLGAVILNSIGIYRMTNIVSMVLFIISIYIGSKYKEHIGAKAGKGISIFFILLMIALTINSMNYS